MPASLTIVADDKYRDMPAGGWGGELATPPAATAAPTPPQPLRIPPPDWEEEAREQRRREQAERMPIDEPANSLDSRPARPEAKP